VSWRLSKRRSSHESAEWTGFLDKSVRFEGTLECPGTFRVEGRIKGMVISTHNLVLGESARVEGQIDGNQVAVSGRFDGAIFAKGRVEIHPTGIVTGEIHTPCLVIEPGGIFDGQCHMLAASEAAKPVTIPIRSSQQA
jgi:cytoskeletal protein CcmA (bactofilin family)